MLSCHACACTWTTVPCTKYNCARGQGSLPCLRTVQMGQVCMGAVHIALHECALKGYWLCCPSKRLRPVFPYNNPYNVMHECRWWQTFWRIWRGVRFILMMSLFFQIHGPLIMSASMLCTGTRLRCFWMSASKAGGHKDTVAYLGHVVGRVGIVWI